MSGYDVCKHGRIRCAECAYVEELEDRIEELEQQNKRYREALEEIMRTETVTTALAEGQVAYTFSGHIARRTLESEE